VTSREVRQLLTSDLGHRYTARDHFYCGTRYQDDIESLARGLAGDLFNAPHVDVRPLSGHIANMALLFAFTKPGDSILSIYPENGGYPGISHVGASKRLELKNLYFPFNERRMRIEVKQTAQTIIKHKPKLVIFGASMILFPQPVSELKQTAHEAGAIVAYDASHVLGLLAGGQFQDPLREGADILLGSTHKSFFGPQGGIILAKSEFAEELEAAVEPSLVDNAHWNRIAALCQALIEMTKFGKDYAQQVQKNAKRLGQALIEDGIPVRCKDTGITESHQVVLAFGGYGKGIDEAHQMDRCNIITDCGIRLGTSEMTRWGMKEKEMDEIANLIATALCERLNPQEIRRRVGRLRRDFCEMQYCFN
jgi:glycine hydroxymethyltransferase